MDQALKNNKHMTIILFTFLWINVQSTNVGTQAQEGLLLEYCQGSTFSPQCEPDEAIMIESARYGHIELGRCIDIDFGHFGCKSDQLQKLDQLCSGKQSCDITINDINLDQELPCSPSLIRYLEAKYRCQKVFQFPAHETCESPGFQIEVNSRQKFLSSSTSSQFNCGSDVNPWILAAKPGQAINMSLIDLNWSSDEDVLNEDAQLRHPCPVRYGYIIDEDLNEAVDICGGSARNKQLHVSKGSSVQVVLDKGAVASKNFIISYQALGCPIYKNAKNTWVKEENEMLIVSCNTGDKSWKLRCIGNNWIGIVGTCEEEQSEDRAVVEEINDEQLLFGVPKVISLTILGGVLLVIICIVFTVLIGIFCINKSKPDKQNQYIYMAPLDHQTLTLNTIGRIGTSPSVQHEDLGTDTMLQGGMKSVVNPHNVNQQASPHYFVLEKDNTIANPEGVYDSVYQNI